MHVVAGDLAQAVFFETVGAAVADPTAQHEFTVVHEHHHGRTDQVDTAGRRGLQQVGVDLDQGVLDRFDEVEHAAGTRQGTEPLYDHVARVVAGRVAS